MTTSEVLDSRRVSLKFLKEDRDLQTNGLFTGTKDSIDECDVVLKYFEQRFYESEVKNQQEDKDVRVVVRIQQFQSNQQ